MITEHFKYYQPVGYSDDGTNIDYTGIPDELMSFQAFASKDECKAWLLDNDYFPGNFAIIEYQDNDIEDVTIIDRFGDVVPRIEEMSDEERSDMILDEIRWKAGGVDNLRTVKQPYETDQEYEDRIYTEALNDIMDAVETIETSGDYNFQTFAGSPEVEWYDEAREWALSEVLAWMVGEEKIDI